MRDDDVILLQGERRVLEMVATNAPLRMTLEALSRLIEAREPGLLCGALVVAANGAYFSESYGPSLPAVYHETIIGLPITPPYIGACGEVAHRGVPVLLPDIQEAVCYTDQWRALLASCGLASLCSLPIVAPDRTVLGAFSMYHDRPGDPRPKDPRLIEIATHLASIALERARALNLASERDARLEASARQFADLIENAPFGTYVIDAYFRVVLASQIARSAFGLDGLIGMDLAEALRKKWPDPFASEAIARFRHTLATGEAYISKDTVEKLADRDVVESYDWRLERIVMGDGDFGVVCYFYDLSERLRMDAELRASESRFASAFEQAPSFIAVLGGPDHVIESANPGYMTLVGRSDIVGRTVAEAFPDAVAQGFLDLLDSVYRSGKAYTAKGARYDVQPVPGGPVEEHFVDLVFQPITDASGGVTRIFLQGVDVTARIRAEASLRESERRLRAVLLQIPAAIFIVEAPDGHVTFKNLRVDELLGPPAEDLKMAKATLRGWALHKDGTPYELSEYPSRRALATGETVRGEPMIFSRSDGRLIDLEMHAGPVYGETGAIVAAVAVALDVTERRAAEARQAFLFRLQDCLRAMNEPAAILSAAATLLGRHLGAARIGFGEMQSDDETVLITNGYVDGAPPVNGFFRLAAFGPFIEQEMRQGRTLVYEDVQADDRAARAFGLELGTRAHVSVPLVRDGRFIGSLYVTHFKPYRWTPEEIEVIEDVAARIWDAAERGRAEARLRDSEGRLRLALDAVIQTATKFESFAQMMPSMVWTSLPDGQIDWFNARVCEYSGIPEADMKPDGWAPVHPDDIEGAIRIWREALESGQPFQTEYRIRRHDGMFRWHLTRAVPIRGEDGSIALWIGTSADIQDQKSSEQALADLNATLEEQVRARTAELLESEATLRQSQKMEAVGQLTGGLAHDFNNLLQGITGSLELLALRVAEGRLAELERYLDTALGAARRAAALTHRLLAFSRRQTLDPKSTDVNMLIDGMYDLICRTVSPLVTVKVANAPGLWAVFADPNQLENALLNLCINARDAMPDGGDLIIETSNLRLEAGEAGRLDLPAADYVSLSVSDTGGGMTADVIEHAFDPFFTTKPIGEGTGLGLSMVYGFVRQSGGQARIWSELGRGAKVCLYLPRYIGGDRVVESFADERKAQHGAGETVLVVDDEPSVRMLINEVLDELGYKVLLAENAGAGLKILEASIRVDLLVTDVGLPGGMNGRQLADAALVTRPDLKILFITGYAERAAFREQLLKPGMHILTKPFSIETLESRVSEIMAEMT